MAVEIFINWLLGLPVVGNVSYLEVLRVKLLKIGNILGEAISSLPAGKEFQYISHSILY